MAEKATVKVWTKPEVKTIGKLEDVRGASSLTGQGNPHTKS